MTKWQEEALFAQCDDLVCELVRHCGGKALEWEDRVMEARLGFLLGLRTYHRVEGVLEFWPYLVACARERIYAAQRAASRQRGVDSRLSLDRSIPGGRGEPMAVFYPSPDAGVATMTELRDFLDRLEPELRTVAWMSIDGYGEQEMARRLHRELGEISALRQDICQQWVVYNEEPPGTGRL